MEKIVNATNLQSITKEITSLNKKLAKRSIPAITIVSSQPKVKEFMRRYPEMDKEVIVSIPYWEVALELPIENMGLANTRVLGYVEITSMKDLILHPISEGAAEIMEGLREGDIRCDHCKLARNRKNTFIFERDGKLVMVGKTCAREYFGFDIAQVLNQFIDIPSDGSGSDSDGDFGGGYGKYFFDRQLYLAACLFLIRRVGFKPSAAIDSTAVDASNLVASLVNGDSKNPFRAEFEESVSTLFEQIKGIFAWFDAIDKTTATSFLLNCRAALRDPQYTKRPMLAASVQAYFKAIYSEMDAARRAEWAKHKADRVAAKAQSTHFGEIGQRIDVVGSYAATISFGMNDFGAEVILVKFFAENGSELCWVTSSDIGDLEVGHKYQIRGTVKKHDEYKGVKQTKLSRCKLTEVTA